MNKAEPNVTVEDITPAKAQELLAHNKSNRKIKQKSLNTLIRAMENGEWEFNGETIKIADDGTIIDGQHRLTACVATGESFRTVIFRGAPMEVQSTVDVGAVRSLKGALEIRGEGNANAKAALVRAYIQHDAVGVRRAVQNAEALTLRECLEFFDENREGIAQDVTRSRKVAQGFPIPATVVAILWREFARLDEDDADYFFDKLLNGLDLAADNPIQALRRQMYGMERDLRGGRPNRLYLAALTIKAWNKFRVGEPVGLLKFRSGGANPETFPEAR